MERMNTPQEIVDVVQAHMNGATIANKPLDSGVGDLWEICRSPVWNFWIKRYKVAEVALVRLQGVPHDEKNFITTWFDTYMEGIQSCTSMWCDERECAVMKVDGRWVTSPWLSDVISGEQEGVTNVQFHRYENA